MTLAACGTLIALLAQVAYRALEALVAVTFPQLCCTSCGYKWAVHPIALGTFGMTPVSPTLWVDEAVMEMHHALTLDAVPTTATAKVSALWVKAWGMLNFSLFLSLCCSLPT